MSEVPVVRLDTIERAIADIRAGKAVVVVDDEDRENEGDVVIAAELATKESVAWMVRNSSGFICAPMTDEIADRLALPLMVENNEDPRGTAYTVTVDASDVVTTGISATDRAHTLRVLAGRASVPSSLRRPGHVLPLRADPGGVLSRAGHTEAAVDLMRLAGLQPVAAIAEIVGADGDMERLPGLRRLGARENVPVAIISDLIAFLSTEP